MELGITLLGQMITFAIFVWFTMRFIWPLLMFKLEERKKKIADGLAAAEKGHVILAQAREDIHLELKQALAHREEIIAYANKHAEKILEEARKEAQKERDDIIRSGRDHVESEVMAEKSKLRDAMAEIVITGTEKILSRDINATDHAALLQEMIKQLEQK